MSSDQDQIIPGFKERLRERRIQLGYSQAKTAKKVGFTLGGYQHLEHGRRTNPSASTVLRLARALRCSTAWLLEGTHKPPTLRHHQMEEKNGRT